MAVALTKRRFTVDEYHRMAEVGILTKTDRVELIDGEIVEMTPVGSRHASVVKRLNALLTGRLGARAIVSVQDPSGSRRSPSLSAMWFSSGQRRTSTPAATQSLWTPCC